MRWRRCAAGEAIVYPTETFYALGVDALSLKALERLFAIKGREPGKPVALIAADLAMAFAVAREVPAQARVLAEAFWPGPLTLVLPARDGIPAALIGADGGVGVRVSSHPMATRTRRRAWRSAYRDQRESRGRAAGGGTGRGARRAR